MCRRRAAVSTAARVCDSRSVRTPLAARVRILRGAERRCTRLLILLLLLLAGSESRSGMINLCLTAETENVAKCCPLPLSFRRALALGRSKQCSRSLCAGLTVPLAAGYNVRVITRGFSSCAARSAKTRLPMLLGFLAIWKSRACAARP